MLAATVQEAHSHEDQARLLRNALVAAHGGESWVFIVETFDASVVYEVETLSGNMFAEPDKFLERTYTINKETEEVTLGPAVEVRRVVTFTPIAPDTDDTPTTPAPPPETTEGDTTPVTESVTLAESGEHSRIGQLVEAALKSDQTVGLRIIEPGQGSSGFYPAAVLERDGPGVFTKGTQMFWNHQTDIEERDRPEGDLRDLAAELITDARWEADGPIGPGLYAEAQVFQPYQAAVNELAGHIGVSIRGQGEATMTPEGPVINRLINAKSVDFVTQAGAGGAILELFESLGEKAHNQPRQLPLGGQVGQEAKIDMSESQELKEAQARITELEERDKQREQETSRVRESLIVRDARDFVALELQEADLPDMAKERLAGQLAQNPPVKEGALDTEALAAKVKEAVDAEANYLKNIIGPARSPVRGMAGAGDGEVNSATNASLNEAFTRLADGNEELGKTAAAGR